MCMGWVGSQIVATALRFFLRCLFPGALTFERCVEYNYLFIIHSAKGPGGPYLAVCQVVHRGTKIYAIYREREGKKVVSGTV